MALSVLFLTNCQKNEEFSCSQIPLALCPGHSHNDYERSRPLFEALECGFISIEADVHLLEGRILVAHDKWQCSKNKTLQNLYLKPLRRIVHQNGGSVYRSKYPLTLMIDIKSDAEPTYLAVHDALAEYESIISVFKNGKFHQKAVDVIISGNRCKELMLKQEIRYAGFDGRPVDLNSGFPPHFMPMISDNIKNITAGSCKAPLRKEQIKKIRQITEKAHEQARKVRFWATQDQPRLWSQLIDAGTDLINVDQLKRFRKYAEKNQILIMD